MPSPLPLVLVSCSRAAGAVADRWHLLANLSEVVERFLDSQRDKINQPILSTLQATDTATTIQPLCEEQLPPLLSWHNDLSTLMTTSQVDYTSKSYERYQKLKQLQSQGYGIRAIARHLGLARNTVKRYWHQEDFVPRQTAKRSNLLLYEGYPGKRWLEGQTNVKELLVEIKNFGYNRDDGPWQLHHSGQLSIDLSSGRGRTHFASCPQSEQLQ